MIPSGMNMNGTPLFPVTRYVAAWPPATAVSGADAATMKNTRSGTPSARRCSLADSPPTGASGAALCATDIGLSPPASGLGEATPIPDEQPEHLRGLQERAQGHALVDSVDPLPSRSEAHGRDAVAHEVPGIGRGGGGDERWPRPVNALERPRQGRHHRLLVADDR